MKWLILLLLLLLILIDHKGWSLSLIGRRVKRAIFPLLSMRKDSPDRLIVTNDNTCLVKITSSYTHQELINILASITKRKMFGSILFIDASNRIIDEPYLLSSSKHVKTSVCTNTTYVYSKATAMLQLMNSQQNPASGDFSSSSDALIAPRWIPVIPGEEEVLVSNGWSFLDADESEPISSFDIDKANEEGQYIPKWLHGLTLDYSRPLSSLGYDLNPLSTQDLLSLADTALSHRVQARSVLLEGLTDPPGRKITNNGYDFSGSVHLDEITEGIFICALGSLPLFATTDLKPCTATSGWLSFTEPLSMDHITLVHPEVSVNGQRNPYDSRVEVICAKTGCHLGHYFGKDGGYCINASALNFMPKDRDIPTSYSRKVWMEDLVESNVSAARFTPVSWKRLTDGSLSSSNKLLLSVLQQYNLPERVALGAGCFWHVEYALSRLPGVVHTTVGFAGGIMKKPTYSNVSKGDSGHAEVVLVTFDPHTISPSVLFDCFFAMHDPTMVRAHGQRAQGLGQYRSCIILDNNEMIQIASHALDECRRTLGLGLSTEILLMSKDIEWFWPAEDRHQRYEERVKRRESATLTIENWMMEYARRSTSIWGSSNTIPIAWDDDGDDGFARMMI